MKKHHRQLLGVLVGLAITPVALAAAVTSAGSGHGSYVLAKLLFPLTMWLTRFSGDTITYALLALALAQYPVYALVVTSFAPWRATLGLICAHAVLVVLSFSFVSPTFS